MAVKASERSGFAWLGGGELKEEDGGLGGESPGPDEQKDICGTEGNNMNERKIIKEGREGEEEEVMAGVNHG